MTVTPHLYRNSLENTNFKFDSHAIVTRQSHIHYGIPFKNSVLSSLRSSLRSSLHSSLRRSLRSSLRIMKPYNSAKVSVSSSLPNYDDHGCRRGCQERGVVVRGTSRARLAFLWNIFPFLSSFLFLFISFLFLPFLFFSFLFYFCIFFLFFSFLRRHSTCKTSWVGFLKIIFSRKSFVNYFLFNFIRKFS